MKHDFTSVLGHLIYRKQRPKNEYPLNSFRNTFTILSKFSFDSVKGDAH